MSRLEDRIRELCAKAVAMRNTDPELKPTLNQLRAAIKEHVRKIRERVVPFPEPERRSNAGD